MRRFWSWVRKGKCGWPTVLLPLIVVAVLFSQRILPLECNERFIRWIGLVLQLLGFVTVAWGLRNLLKEFKNLGFITVLQNYLDSFPLHPPKTHSREVRITVQSSLSASGVVIRGDSIEAHVEHLKSEIERLDAKLGQVTAAQQETEERLVKQAAEYDKILKNLKDSLENLATGGIPLELCGVVCFVIGVFLATGSPEIASFFGYDFSCQKPFF